MNRTELNVKLVKRATVGLIGDRVTTMTTDDLRARVEDQADRFDVYPPSWSAFVDAARLAGLLFLDLDTVELPVPGVNRSVLTRNERTRWIELNDTDAMRRLTRSERRELRSLNDRLSRSQDFTLL